MKKNSFEGRLSVYTTLQLCMYYSLLAIVLDIFVLLITHSLRIQDTSSYVFLISILDEVPIFCYRAFSKYCEVPIAI